MLALVRLLSRVCPDVHRQGTALDEAFSATGDVARVRSLVGVYAVVSLQIRFAVEALLHASHVSDLPRLFVEADQSRACDSRI